jgi:alkanesulfonate monooxygenase SsuD/methylene tetrahydromethanopterin reductase-like flavin-dependent oxidoreductase (luciferase family)
MAAAKIGVSCGGDHWTDDQLRSVETLGYDSFWTGEHIVYHRPILEAVTVLTRAAALTSKIKIGPATLILPLRHPTMVAKQFSSLDVQSNGRVRLTVGVGGDYPREFAACDVPVSESGQRTQEAIEIMRKYWSGQRFDYDGKIFKLKDVDMLPRPLNGTIPIWVSGRQEAPLKRAALLGDGWHPYMYTPERCRESFHQVVKFASEGGRTLPKDYVFACFIYVALYDDVEEARNLGIKELSYRYDQDFSERGLVDRYCAYGPPEKVIEYLSKYVEAGTNYLILAPIMPPERRVEHLERIAKEVVPALNKISPRSIV